MYSRAWKYFVSWPACLSSLLPWDYTYALSIDALTHSILDKQSHNAILHADFTFCSHFPWSHLHQVKASSRLQSPLSWASAHCSHFLNLHFTVILLYLLLYFNSVFTSSVNVELIGHFRCQFWVNWGHDCFFKIFVSSHDPTVNWYINWP